MAGFQEYGNYDGLGLAKLVRDGEITPLELVDEAISRIESVNPQINAVIHKMYDSARAAASGDLPDGPYRGIPFLIKDLLSAYAGEPMRCGSRFLKDYVPDYDSEMVRRNKAAGLITLGKTNTPELGIVSFTEPEIFGPTNNPWDMSRTTGGSSGGSAAAPAVVTAAVLSASHHLAVAYSDSSPRDYEHRPAPASVKSGTVSPSSTSSPAACATAQRCWMLPPVPTWARHTSPPPQIVLFCKKSVKIPKSCASPLHINQSWGSRFIRTVLRG